MACSLPRPEASALADLALFGGLDDSTLARFAAELDVLTLGEGDAAVVEGSPGREMFVVLEGTLEAVRAARRGGHACIARLGPGDLVGEIALLDMTPRSATVTATSRARLLRLTTGQLDALYRRDPRSYALLMMNLARELARKLRATSGALADERASVGDH